MKFINALRDGDRISQVFLCKQKQMLTGKSGKSYGALVLQDKTGTVDAKIWDFGPGIENFEAADFIYVDAEVNTFNNNLQVVIRRLRVAREGEYVQNDYLPMTTKDIDVMYKELIGLIAKVSNSKLRELLESFFIKDAQFVKEFKTHSAAKSVHHGFIGGLLEHTLSVTKLCYFYCQLYPQLNKDLLLTAAMFHDIGKLKEISDFPVNDYTDEGQLLGHIVIGCEMVGERIKSIPDFPSKTATELRHCILAHHGEFEYGSPKKPALMEAAALNFADNTDARMETFIEQVVGAQSKEWLGFNRFIDSNVRKTTPTE